jgi:rhamnogalacturonyl hydrolase YesR
MHKLLLQCNKKVLANAVITPDNHRMTSTASRRQFLLASSLATGALLGLASPGSAATALSRATVIADLRRAADYWISQPPLDNNAADWINATFHSGNMALYKLIGVAKYRDYSLAWATANKFEMIHTTRFFADNEAAGQVYLDLYADDQQPSYLTAVRQRMSDQVASGRDDFWTWVDAINMAMPTLVRTGALDGHDDYFEAAHSMYAYAKGKLYDPARGLWWRDSNYVDTDTYWSRGNGWAITAQAKILAALPSNAPHRAEYVSNIQEMAATLKNLQRSDGFWNASLTQPTVDAGPETSGTAFHVYGIAWGINNGVLDAATYLPVVTSAWQALTTVSLQRNGFLGYVQGTGSKPSDHYPWSTASTQAFGVGAFLLAGTEVARLA